MQILLCEPALNKTNKVAYASNKDSDQPGKLVFRVCDQVRLKLVCSATEAS